MRMPSGSAEGNRCAPKYLGIPGMRDVNVNKYCIWHCSKNANTVWKMEYKKACDLTLAEGLDLEQIHLDQDAQFFVDKGVKIGIAKRWVSDVEVWFRDMETLEDLE
jgi:putative lipase involved disintegration of autophagic bodies